jgi:hypothetical protein
MTAKSKSNSDQTRQNDNLVKRLTKPLLQPGIINLKFADNIISRTRNMTARSSPLLMRLVERKGMINDTGGEHIQIVNAHWVQNNKDRSLKKDEFDNGRLVKPTIQRKKKSSGLSNDVTYGDIESKSHESHLPTVKAIPQALHSENISKPKPTANLQMKEVDSGAAAKGKTTFSAGTANTIQGKKKSSGLSNDVTYGDIESKSHESHLPTVKAIPQALHSENISKPKPTANLQMKEVDSGAAAKGKTTFSAGTANTIQGKKKSFGLSNDVTCKDVKPHSENVVKSETKSVSLQKREVDSGTTVKPESNSHTAIVKANTIKQTIQQKGKTFDLPRDPLHERIEPNSEGQRLNNKKITASVNTETHHQVDNTKWKIARRGLPTAKLSLPAIQEKTNTDNRQFVIKKKSNNSSSNASLDIRKKGVEDRVTNIVRDKGADVTTINDKMISGKTAVAEKSVSLPESMSHTSIAMPIIRKKGDTYQESSNLIVKSSFPEPTIFRKENNSISSVSPLVSKKIKNNILEPGIALKTETPSIICSTSYQIQRTPALIWRNNESNTTPASISPRQTVHPVKKPISVSMSSAGENMLSMSNQAVSSHESVIEANSMDTIENNISEQRTSSGSSRIDLSKIADQVSRIIYRKLAVERERRGV